MRDSIPFKIEPIHNPGIQDSLYQQIFNPFNGEMAETISGFTYNTSIEDNKIDNVRYSGTPLPFNMEQTDSIFILLLICFLSFAHIYNGGISFLKENISLLFSHDKESRIHRQTTIKELVYSYFLILQTVILISICLYDIFVEYDSVGVVDTPLFKISVFILLIGLFIVLKDFIYRTIGYIFNKQKLMNMWRHVSIVSLEILGIVYFIPTLLLIYSNYCHFAILILMLILFLIIQIILFSQIIIFFVNQKFNFLYLIAYLCTFEILPYIFLSTGLIYLYKINIFDALWL